MIYAHNFSYKEKKEYFYRFDFGSIHHFSVWSSKNVYSGRPNFRILLLIFRFSGKFFANNIVPSVFLHHMLSFCVLLNTFGCSKVLIICGPDSARSFFEKSVQSTPHLPLISQEWPRWPPFLFHILFPPIDLFLCRNFKGRFIVKIYESRTKFPKKLYRSV